MRVVNAVGSLITFLQPGCWKPSNHDECSTREILYNCHASTVVVNFTYDYASHTKWRRVEAEEAQAATGALARYNLEESRKESGY